MKTTKALNEWLIAGFTLLPLMQFLYLWKALPDQVPIHFNLQGAPDSIGSKALVASMLLVLSLGIYFLLKYAPLTKTDRENFRIFSSTYAKLRLVLAAFFAVIGFIIVSAIQNNALNSALLYIIIMLFVSIMGNYMSNLRPNHFIGIRTPWTLGNEQVWRKTHHRAGRLWFIAGMAAGCITLALPASYAFSVFVGMLLVIVVYPVAYSYVLHNRLGKQGPTNANETNG